MIYIGKQFFRSFLNFALHYLVVQKQIAGSQNCQRNNYIYIIIVDHSFALVDHFKVGHVACQRGKVPPQQCQHRCPDARTQGGKKAEPLEVHFRQSRRNADELADRREQPADKGRQLAIFPENFFGTIQRRFFQEKVFAVAMQKGPPSQMAR